MSVTTSRSSASAPPVADEAQLERSRAACRAIARRRARNFYYGMKLAPEPKRAAMFALYAWMRLADDLTDDGTDIETRRAALGTFGERTRRAIAGRFEPATGADNSDADIWPAFTEMVERYGIPARYLDAMIEGQRLDLDKTRYATFEELYDYCYKVASVVGLCCIEIWGYEGGEETRKLAEWRGIAFQLTNILRDVLEDARRDRVYVPAADFDLFDLSPTLFTMGRPADAAAGLRRLADRAADFYRRSLPLDERVHRDGRPCLIAMTRIYKALLDKIAPDPTIVLTGRRVRLSGWRKGWIALRAVIGRGRS